MFGEVAVTPDDKVFGFTFTPSANQPEGAIEPRGDIVLLDPATTTIQKVASFLGKNFQVLFADADSRWITWSEASSQPGFEDWVLLSYDRNNGQTHTVGRAATAGGFPVPSQYVEPRLDHDLIVWSAGVSRPTLGLHTDCFMAPASGDQPPTVLAADCINPVISWPYVLYDQHQGPELGGYVELTVLDLRNQEHHAFRGIRNSKYYALAATSVTYTTENSKTIHLADLLNTNDQTLMDVTTKDGGYIQFPALSERLAVWSESEGSWAYDRKMRRLVRLSSSPGFGSVYLRSPGLVWADYTRPNSTSRDDRVLRTTNAGQLD